MSGRETDKKCSDCPVRIYTDAGGGFYVKSEAVLKCCKAQRHIREASELAKKLGLTPGFMGVPYDD